ncbi:MAG: pentapeptide repeat-containing protein [Arenicellales bacterium]
MRGARLAYAVLSNVDLRFAVLDGADLSGANLSGAWMMAGDLEVQINDGSVWSG